VSGGAGGPACGDAEASRVRVLDPACGDGALLAAAFDALGGRAELHGVDVDPAAVVAAEGRLVAAGAEPSAVHIRRRDALAMRWDERFDVVLSNPPWGAEIAPAARQERRDIIVRTVDSFMFFVDLALDLVGEGGQVGLLVPDVILYQSDNERLRRKLLRKLTFARIENLGEVFDGVTRPAAMLCATRRRWTDGDRIQVAQHGTSATVDHRLITSAPGAMFITRDVERYVEWRRITDRIETTLADLVDSDGIQRGASPDLKAAFIVDDPGDLEHSHLRPVLTGGKHVKANRIEPGGEHLIYTTRDTDFQRLPRIRRHIDRYADRITCAEVRSGKHSRYALHRPRAEHIFTKPSKLLGVITADRPIVAVDEQRYFATDGLYVFAPKPEIDPRFLAAVLNSDFVADLYRLLASEQGRVLPQVKPKILAQLPIPLGRSDLRSRISRASPGDVEPLVVALYRAADTTNAE